MHRTKVLLAILFAAATVLPQYIQAQNTREEFGKCGYYADALQGRKTASGEKYDKKLLTCAHKTLAFGTKVRVTRLDNGKSVVVRVNDRGPYIDGYVTDISRKAAETIGLVRDGVTRVKITIVEAAPGAKAIVVSNRVLPKELEPTTYSTTTTTAQKAQLIKSKNGTVVPATYSTTPQPQSITATSTSVGNIQSTGELFQVSIKAVAQKGFALQVGVLTTTENLFQEVAKLQATWPGKVVVNHEEMKDVGAASFKLLLGPFPTRKDAEAQQRKAASKGYKKSFVVDLSE